MNIKPIQKFFSNPKNAEFAKNTGYAVLVQTGLKAVGRPIFIYKDKCATDESTKKYAATKELIYQGFSLLLALVALPSFKKYGYKFFKNVVFKKNPEYFAHATRGEFKDLKAFDAYRKEVEHAPQAREFTVAKGSVELSSLIGSVVTLAIIAPQLSQYIVHPIMKMVGFDKANEKPKAGCSACANVKEDYSDFKGTASSISQVGYNPLDKKA